MLPYRDSHLTKIGLAIFFVMVIAYAYFEARGLLYGPVIKTTSEVTVSHDRFITIHGSAERIAELSMNGKQLSVTEQGAFEEPYLLANGYNRIVLRARDKYGRTSEKVVEIIYEPPVSDASSAASSTPVAP
ncbi:MAG: hypothetical protein AAB830_02485 [Patescibacteria group bacterium]